jgi:hypothetical protein
LSTQHEAGACRVTFPVRNGIYGVDRVAKQLVALAADGQIGEWHIDQWIDWRHTAIRICFSTVNDANRAKLICFDGSRASSKGN